MGEVRHEARFVCPTDHRNGGPNGLDPDINWEAD